MPEPQPIVTTATGTGGDIRIILESGKVSPPTNLAVGADRKTLSWTAPSSSAADENIAYQLTYTSATDFHKHDTNSPDTTALIPPALREARYNVAIRTTKNGNFSDTSTILPIIGGLPNSVGSVSGGSNLTNVTVNDKWLYITDNNNNRVVRIEKDAKTNITANADYNVATGLNNPWGATVDGKWLYIADTYTNRVVKVEKDAKTNITASTAYEVTTGLNKPRSIVVDDTWLYITDYENGRVVRIDKDAKNISVTGSDYNVATGLKNPWGLAVDGKWLYITSDYNRVVRVEKDAKTNITGSDYNVATGLKNPSGLAVDGKWLYIAETSNNRVVRVEKDGKNISVTASDVFSTDLSYPGGVVVDSTWLYISSPSELKRFPLGWAKAN
ncbi:NHL repeat-containing protein [Streptomyces formicae]|uniref:NHL repeat-containing protein n=1 Tax=Streptomyces formicae TaxID=1616117 RepID=A0ABY3WTT3_9ACTN|nr:NHL repeat-containing protein [Streptomyces formicae]UNM13193.1 NHL repeat-containing protein [Streptomyces formicae]